MSTASPTKPVAPTAITKPPETTITYVPLGEVEPIHLTLGRVKTFLCIPTKSGKMPTDEQVMKYMMLCKAQCLNPWVNDAYLVGYDGKDGPQFSLITAHQAILKRAEASPEFDGLESGVIVAKGDVVTERQGDLVLKGEAIVGAWARVHRRDRSIPSYDSLNLSTFDTGRSRWAADPAGMIVKCAEASALRKAFPSTLAAMYCKEEMDRERELNHAQAVDARPKADRLAARLTASTTTPAAIIHQQPEAAGTSDQLATQNDEGQALRQRIFQVNSSDEAAELERDILEACDKGEITSEESDELAEMLRKEMS